LKRGEVWKIPVRGYGEYGVRVLGSLGYPPAVVTPHASALTLAVTLAKAVANLRRLAERFDVYGDFGLRRRRPGDRRGRPYLPRALMAGS
jgi:hypothetical protein